jgi:tetratricopeptide (TPR) repeat protein
MLVGTFREEDLSELVPLRRMLDELGPTARVERLELAPLTQSDTLSLVRALAPAAKGAAFPILALGEQIWRNSQGNPLVIVETIRALQENPPRAVGAALPLPARIYELIANRIDRLGQRAQHLVAVAAVIGRAFDFQLLQRAANLGPEPAAEGVEELIRLRILRGVGEAFDFSHDRFREVAYQRLPRALQRELHHQVALALEALYSGELESQSTALGFHFEAASIWTKAAHYLRLAGLQAFGRSANRDAVAFFERGLSVLTHPLEGREMLALAIDIRLDLRNALWQLGQLDAVLDNLRLAERLARRLDDPLRLGWVSAFMGFQLWLAGDPTHGRSFGERACRLAKEPRTFALGILGDLCVGMSSHALGDFRTAEDRFAAIIHLLPGVRGRERFGASGLPAAQAHAWLGWCLAERGQFDKVIAHGQEAVRLADAADHPWSLAVACWALGFLHIIRGEHGEATQVLQRGLALCRDWRLPLWSPLLTWLLAYAHARLGRITDGVSVLTEALDTIEARGLALFQTPALMHSAEVHMLAGQPDVALAIVERAISLTRDRKQRPCEGRALKLRADLAAAAPQPHVAEAEEDYGAALAIATELGMRPLVAECRWGLGSLYRRLGRIDAAETNLNVAASAFRQMGIVPPEGAPTE